MGIMFKLKPATQLSGTASKILDVLVGACDGDTGKALAAKADEAHKDIEEAKVKQARTDTARRLGIDDIDSQDIDATVKRLQKATVKAKAMRLALLAHANNVAPVEQARKMMNTAVASEVLKELREAMHALGENPADYVCERNTRTRSGYGKATAAPSYVLAWWDLTQTVAICQKANAAPISKNMAKAA